jgi:hypothetical protein
MMLFREKDDMRLEQKESNLYTIDESLMTTSNSSKEHNHHRAPKDHETF